MKILQLGKFYPVKGGVERVMIDLVNGLSEKGIYCDMLCASLNRKGYEIRLNKKAKIFCVPTWKKMFATMIAPYLILKLRRIKDEYDIIHIHHPDPMVALSLFFSGYRGKVVLHWHSDILKQKIMLKLYTPLQLWLIKRADVIIGTTPKYIEESPFLKIIGTEKKYCIPIGIDPIVPDNDKVKKIKEQFFGKKIVFSLGRLVEYKGFSYLIDAAKYLSDEYVILIGGSGPLFYELESKVIANSFQNKVKLLKKVPDDDLASYYGACDVYVMSSIWKTEAFGIVQIEAMSCGRPVVATDIPGSGVSWVNADKISGLNVIPQNSKAIADAIYYITSDKLRYNEFSQNAKERYLSLFKKEYMINNCVELYKLLMS